MIKAITKIGNSQGIIFDSALMELAHLKVGDEMSVTCHDGGSIILTPTRPLIDPEQAANSAKRIIGKNEELFRRLS
jgi:antitoxin component of MazEF toxin-antitoxin module